MHLPPSSLSRSACQRAAYHEAGHAAAVVYSQGVYWLRGISLRVPSQEGNEVPERHRHTGAHLTIDPPAKLRDLCSPQQRVRAEALLVAILAGSVAESMLLGQPPCEYRFRHELASHGLYPLLHVHGRECVLEYRGWLQARAIHLVACHWRGISRLAAALMEYQDLSGQEVARFLQVAN